MMMVLWAERFSRVAGALVVFHAGIPLLFVFGKDDENLDDLRQVRVGFWPGLVDLSWSVEQNHVEASVRVTIIGVG